MGRFIREELSRDIALGAKSFSASSRKEQARQKTSPSDPPQDGFVRNANWRTGSPFDYAQGKTLCPPNRVRVPRYLLLCSYRFSTTVLCAGLASSS
jgi:hypothetical protein